MRASLAAARTLPLLVALLALVSCGEGPSTQATTEPELRPLPELGALGEIDPKARQQLSEAYSRIERLEGDPAATRSGRAWAWGQLGMVLHAYMLLNPARDCYENATQLDPQEVRWPYYLGNALYNLGQLEAADRAWQSALSLRPEEVAIHVWLGESDLQQLQPAAAREHFQSALKLYPTAGRARLGLARVFQEQDQPEEAIPILESLLEAQPQATQVHHALVTAYRSAGRDEEAAKILARIPRNELARVSVAHEDPLLEQVSNLRRTAQHHARKGMKALSQGQLEAAMRNFEQAVELDPDRSDTRYNLAAILLRLGLREQGVAELSELVQRNPDYSYGRIARATLLIDEDELDTAEAELRAVIAADDSEVAAYLPLGKVLVRRGRNEEALAGYARAQQLAPERVDLRRARVLLLGTLGRWPQARQELEDGSRDLPQATELGLLLARVLAASPDAELRDGERALLLAPEESSIRNTAEAETRAMALMELGRREEAIRWQERALELAKRKQTERVRERLRDYQAGRPCRLPWTADEL